MTQITTIEQARRLLNSPVVRSSPWAGLAAAALAASSALMMAGAVIVGPGFETSPPAVEQAPQR